VTLDGGPLTGQGGMARNTMLNNFSGTMLEQIELIKGHTPDKGADSLGGTLNLRSRSPLSLREPRRTNYSLNLRTAPSFTEQIPARESHRVHPVLNVAHQQVFDAPGGERNLGVSLNLFYSENVVAYFSSVRDFENTTREPAYLWDYRTTDFYANRKQWSVNLKAEHRLSPATRLRFNAIYNDTNVTDRRTHELRAYTSQTVGTTGTAGILPGYTSRITEVPSPRRSSRSRPAWSPPGTACGTSTPGRSTRSDRGTSTGARATAGPASIPATAERPPRSRTGSPAWAGFSTARPRISTPGSSRPEVLTSPTRPITDRRRRGS
jgi:hypothetical protein